MEYIKRDARSITGSNLRNLLLISDKDDIDDLTAGAIDNLRYHEVNEVDRWRIDAILELNDVKFDQAVLDSTKKNNQMHNL